MQSGSLATRRRRQTRFGFTLIEILIVVTLLGLAGALVVPHMGRSDSLQTQAGVRAIVADISFAQFDAMANQTVRRVEFDLENNRVRLLGGDFTTGDPADTFVLEDPLKGGREFILEFDDDRFGGTTLQNADFDGNTYITFDEVGGPVDETFQPSTGGTVEVVGPHAHYEIRIGAFTGRVTVVNLLNGGGGN
jgi:prepilin-type N-terminal cleavage/methylation domain-containing protein